MIRDLSPLEETKKPVTEQVSDTINSLVSVCDKQFKKSAIRYLHNSRESNVKRFEKIVSSQYIKYVDKTNFQERVFVEDTLRLSENL